MQSQEEKSYSGSESEMKQILALTSSLLASSASYFLISWQKPSRFFATTVEWLLPRIFQNFSWRQLSEEQKFSRENFRGLIKIRENCKSFLNVKLLSFTVFREFPGVPKPPKNICLKQEQTCINTLVFI